MRTRRTLGARPPPAVRAAQADLLDALPGVRLAGLGHLNLGYAPWG
ncbi:MULTISPECIES: hypothetical protein [Streptomyces]|nr:hypothetical protein [Streptomyces durhamensis]